MKKTLGFKFNKGLHLFITTVLLVGLTVIGVPAPTASAAATVEVLGVTDYIIPTTGQRAAGDQTIAITNAVAAGSTILVAVQEENHPDGSSPIVGDTANGTYTRLITQQSSTARDYQSVYAIYNSTALTAGTVITIDQQGSGPPSWIQARAIEIIGLADNPLDQTASAGGQHRAGEYGMDSGSTAATTQADELLIGSFGWGNGTRYATEGSGWTFASGPSSVNSNATNGIVMIQYREVSSTGTYNAEATMSEEAWWNAIILTFKLAPSTDFGDAPDPTYPTLLASTGASHILGSNVYLGACVDHEPDGQPSADATGDDLGVGAPVFGTCAGTNDENGVVFTSALYAGSTANVTVTASAGCTLSAWVDFNGDGDWEETNEDIFPGGQALAAGDNPLSFPIPAGAVAGITYARFRCTTDGVVSYTGQASDGEVEDYQVTIQEAESIPALSGWGGIIFVVLLLSTAFIAIRRRRRFDHD